MQRGEASGCRESRARLVFDTILWVATVTAACGAASHHDDEDAGLRSDASTEREGGVDQDAGDVDGGLEYDCEAACRRDPRICRNADPDATACFETCRLIAGNRGCFLGEELRLLECLEANPGACEMDFVGNPCFEEYECYFLCGDDPGGHVCRPPRD